MSKCIEWAEERTRECTEYRDEGYNACAEYKDKGYNACSDWDSRCCDWWPCSWFCKLLTWFCVAWYWVSNIVCVAWYWVSNIVCVAWTWVTTAFCLVWDVVTTVVNAIIETLESILSWVLSALAFIIELIFSIPILGRILKWIWNIILTAFWGLVGLIDAALGVIGIRPEKKLRVCVIVLRDENGTAVAQTSNVVTNLQAAIDIFRQEANVRIIPSAPFQYGSGFAGPEEADESWVHVNPGSSGPGVLDVDCGSGAAGEDLWVTGSEFEFLASTRCFYSNFRRVLGYGAPVIIFIVRSFSGGDIGCSLGPLTDYITILGRNPICIAHELGHSCNLWHVGGANNLMNAACGRTELSWWQVAILRNSRHVTYF